MLFQEREHEQEVHSFLKLQYQEMRETLEQCRELLKVSFSSHYVMPDIVHHVSVMGQKSKYSTSFTHGYLEANIQASTWSSNLQIKSVFSQNRRIALGSEEPVFLWTPNTCQGRCSTPELLFTITRRNCHDGFCNVLTQCLLAFYFTPSWGLEPPAGLQLHFSARLSVVLGGGEAWVVLVVGGGD